MIKIIEPYSIIFTPKKEIEDLPRRIELAGRTCYKSEDKITRESSDKFVRSLIKRGHESVLEHCDITVKIVCDRACSHQLVRHRIAAYSQESQRYCDYSSKKHGDGGLQVICPPNIALASLSAREDGTSENSIFAQWEKSIERSYNTYRELRDNGVPAEDSRSVLPNATKTEVVTTFNVRQWRHVFRERALNPHAQWQIRRIMQGIYQTLRMFAPCAFNDLNESGIWKIAGLWEPFNCYWLEDVSGNEADIIG